MSDSQELSQASPVDKPQTELETLFPPSPEELELRQILDDSRSRLRDLLLSHPYDKRWMSADEQIRWKDAKRQYSTSGSTSFISSKGVQGPFVNFDFDGKEYLKSEDGVFAYDSDRNPIPCEEPSVLASIEKLEADDRRIGEARLQLAKDYAEGDPILEEILQIHLEFNGGQITALAHEGILFFQVGRNASHEFYAGARDGKRYVLSCGEDCEFDENGDPIPNSVGVKYCLREAGEGWGYLGHF